MEHNQYDLLEVLDHIEPAELDYQQWVNVGMPWRSRDTRGRLGCLEPQGPR